MTDRGAKLDLIRSRLNPRQLRLAEEFLRRVFPKAMIHATLRQPDMNNMKVAHYRGPVGIHLIMDISHNPQTARSYFTIRRAKEWMIRFSTEPKSSFGEMGHTVHVGANGETYEHNPKRPEHLPFFKGASVNLSIKRDKSGRGVKMPEYINLAYWMVEFGDVAFIETVVNIDAIERDLTVLLMDR